MTAYFVSRHKGAVEWAKRRGIDAILVSHFGPHVLKPGDTVLGTLPIPTAARVCALGCRFFNLSMDVPPEERGRELSADDMENYHAELTEYYLERISDEQK